MRKNDVYGAGDGGTITTLPCIIVCYNHFHIISTLYLLELVYYTKLAVEKKKSNTPRIHHFSAVSWIRRSAIAVV